MALAHAPGRVHGVALVLEHHLRWYARNWRATAISSVLQPLLFLLAFGLGFGSLVGERAAQATGGVEYLVWLAPALLAMSAVQTGAFEMSYPVLAGFKWRRTYEATTATPITGGQVAMAQLAFVATKSLLTGLVSLAVIAVFGGVRSVGVLGSVVAAVLTGAAVAALVMAFSASRRDEGAAFNALFRFVVLPMTLFSGTFFPIANLPGWVQPFAWISPLWHGTELARWAAGVAAPGGWAVLGHLAYLLVLVGIGCAVSVRLFVRRLAQ